ncbi:hypothetical protein EDD16DRAFT_1657697 [Pisolithus croceorrhizus]|nr:hypothetical protein EDD16DRAFT_1657697 [Pisolithus croceorrhizus]KAI6127793.1 hypothetical protein EV401DRAFT_1933224 [Pisolithus croceorrhizus]
MANENTVNVKDLSSSKTAALQALLSSFRQATGEDRSAPGLSQDGLQKLSAKIEEILGDGPSQSNAQGELLNEEGLPIVEITEPVSPSSEAQSGLPFTEEPDLIPLHVLPPSERERRRRECARIFDILEEEERSQQLREELGETERRKEEMRRRKEAARMEYEHLKQAKELQKKMGRALVGSTSGSSETDPRPLRQVASDSKKSVTFAEPVPSDVITTERQPSQADCGDITAGRLRSSHRVPPVSAAMTDKHVMKVQVVERRGENTSGPTMEHVADSDDESPTLPEPSSSQRCATEPRNIEQRESSMNDTSSDEAQSVEETLDESFDWDSAQHQREVAFEYFAKRHVIGTEAVRALAINNDDEGETECVSNGRSFSQRAPMSRFRADRMAEAYGKSHPQLSTSLGSTVVPEARQKALRNSIRMGNLVNDQLAGGPSGDSGSEDEDVKEMIDALKKGDVQNIGPTSRSLRSSSGDLPSYPTDITSGSHPLSTVRERVQLPLRHTPRSGSFEGEPIALSSGPEGSTTQPNSGVTYGHGMQKKRSRFMAERQK